MSCKVCGAERQGNFSTEIAIHLWDTLVFVFPKISVCLNCGKPEIAEEYAIPESELRLLAKGDAAGAG